MEEHVKKWLKEYGDLKAEKVDIYYTDRDNVKQFTTIEIEGEIKVKKIYKLIVWAEKKILQKIIGIITLFLQIILYWRWKK